MAYDVEMASLMLESYTASYVGARPKEKQEELDYMCAYLILMGQHLQQLGFTARSLKAVVAALSVCRGSPAALDAQLAGMRIIEALGGMAVTDRSAMATLVAAGGLEASIASLRDHLSSLELAVAAIATVGNLSATDPPSAARAVASDAAAAIVAATRAHAGNKDLQIAACTALGNLMPRGNPLGPPQASISAAGGVEACVAAMRRFPSHTDVQLAGCFLLANLAVVSSMREEVRVAGGVEAVVRALKTTAGDDAQLLTTAATAIGTLTNECPENCVAATEAGAVEALVDALRRPAATAEREAATLATSGRRRSPAGRSAASWPTRRASGARSTAARWRQRSLCSGGGRRPQTRSTRRARRWRS